MISNLTINKKYLLYTLSDSIYSEPIEVVSVLNYTQASKIPYNIMNLAINEKVVEGSGENGTEDYLKKQLFYHCTTINDSTRNFIIWDGVLDTVRTTLLDSEYKYTLYLTTSGSLETPMTTVLDKINSFIAQEFKNTIDSEFIEVSINGINEKDAKINELTQSLEEAMSVVRKIASLKQIETLIEQLATSQMVDRVQSISETLTEITETVNNISSIIA
jgi:methyl-accepting chemotaxis protein